MGAQEYDETQALLPCANKQDTAVAVALEEDVNAWRGSLLTCCSGCDANARDSCLLSYFVPCVAFGQNMKRALNKSALTQTVIFLVLFLSGRSLYVWSSEAVDAACPRPLPPLHEHHGHHHNLAHADFTAQLYAGFSMKEATPLPGSFEESEIEGHPHQSHHAPPPPMTPECHQALAALGATCCLMLVFASIGVVYAARRRTQIREKFGIAGSRFGDFCAWCWCAPCALCQETRTILANNVQNGVWHGQIPNAAVVPVYTAPEVADMKSEYKPVDAKDFV